MNETILETKQISKEFHDPVTIRVLDNVTFSVQKGEFISIIGKSGCGKSTLLYILSTMDTDYSGELYIENENMKTKTNQQLAHIRNEKIGFVFQFHYLLNEFSVLENVMLPALKLGRFSEKEIRTRAMEKLKMLDVHRLADKRANSISGGEKQRVAIARALVNDPAIIMGDEPTGNLDSKNREIVFNIFKLLAEKYHQTLLIVTHDQTLAERSHRVIEMEDGRVIRH